MKCEDIYEVLINCNYPVLFWWEEQCYNYGYKILNCQLSCIKYRKESMQSENKNAFPLFETTTTFNNAIKSTSALALYSIISMRNSC